MRSQRARRRARYRGCSVCGLRGAHCTECGLGPGLVALHGAAHLALVVDGSFVTEVLDGGGPGGHGGAGLVLVRGDEILASRACGFGAQSSSDAELHAVIRGARWAPGVPIYTDVRELPAKMGVVNPDLSVRYLVPGDRGAAYALAHRLSIEGRCRAAPQTVPRLGVEFAAERPQRTRAGRRQRAAELLLERALRDPAFGGDFTVIAAELGWTSGPRWRDNPVIGMASQLWGERREKGGVNAQSAGDRPPLTK